MSVSYADPARRWLLPSCGPACRPGDHDPRWHEAHGFLLALWTPPATAIRTGPLAVDLRAERVFISGREITLGGRRMRGMLMLLARRLDQPVSADEILHAVWGPAWASGRRADLNVERVALGRLRRALGPAGALIETGKGGMAPGWRRLRYVVPLEP
jgi:hypothetical protein